MRIFTAVVVCILLIDCSTRPSSEAFQGQSFVSLDSIILSQQRLLIGKKLTKSVLIDDVLEKSIISIDSSFIGNEWSFLKEFNLNKPAFIGGIKTTKAQNVVRYEPKSNESYLFGFLEYRFGTNGEIIQVSGGLKDEKAKSLYESTREFTFEFSDGVIEKYTISGYQKIIMNDTVFFQVTGEL